ncbi:hypothetical protein M569_09431 [Genlisea aurea]|uniref:Uncharacterized protein n=1 Tax=Genlisea aurea TaxID=192259 RepID=S8DZB9_9LAMI|nr:hypothetical protein M569_09431 [Genlisea aurea]
MELPLLVEDSIQVITTADKDFLRNIWFLFELWSLRTIGALSSKSRKRNQIVCFSGSYKRLKTSRCKLGHRWRFRCFSNQAIHPRNRNAPMKILNMFDEILLVDCSDGNLPNELLTQIVTDISSRFCDCRPRRFPELSDFESE